MKTIFRSKNVDHFTTLPNKMLRDRNLTLRARGLLAMILSHSDEWQVTKEWLLGQSPTEGKHTMQAMFRELESNGYAVMVEVREAGKIKANVWTFYGDPVVPSERSSFTQKRVEPDVTLPLVEEPLTDKPASGEPATKKIMGEKEGTCSEETLLPKTDKERPRDPIFDALAEVSGFDLKEMNGSAGGMIAKARKCILESTPEVCRNEIFRRANVLRKRWPSASVTPTSLAKHWPTLSETTLDNKTNDLLREGGYIQ